MDISWAVQQLRDGKRVCRASWVVGTVVLMRYPEQAEANYPYFYLWDADNLVPWHCTDADLMADDWRLPE